MRIKIAIFTPASEFTVSQKHTLSQLGEVVYIQKRSALSLPKLLSLAKGADIIAPDPDAFGGFEKASPRLTQVMDVSPHLKGICLSTTSFGWIDLDYCQKRHLPVCNIPGYSRESVAEHTLALLLCLAKRILITDRQTQKGQYQLGMGFELKGKTLGIIGLGNIGSRVAELGQGIGMKVIAYNHSRKHQTGVEAVSLKQLLKRSDAITLHVTHEDKNRNLLGPKEISLMKPGVIIANTADRELIDESTLAKTLKTNHAYGYAYEAEDLINTPLSQCENAIGLKGFGWYTKEALNNLYEIWVDNIVSLARGHPQNRVA